MAVGKINPLPDARYNYFKKYVEFYNNYNAYKTYVHALIGSRYNINDNKLRNTYNKTKEEMATAAPAVKARKNTRRNQNSRRRKTRRANRK